MNERFSVKSFSELKNIALHPEKSLKSSESISKDHASESAEETPTSLEASREAVQSAVPGLPFGENGRRLPLKEVRARFDRHFDILDIPKERKEAFFDRTFTLISADIAREVAEKQKGADNDEKISRLYAELGTSAQNAIKQYERELIAPAARRGVQNNHTEKIAVPVHHSSEEVKEAEVPDARTVENNDKVEEQVKDVQPETVALEVKSDEENVDVAIDTEKNEQEAHKEIDSNKRVADAIEQDELGRVDAVDPDEMRLMKEARRAHKKQMKARRRNRDERVDVIDKSVGNAAPTPEAENENEKDIPDWIAAYGEYDAEKEMSDAGYKENENKESDEIDEMKIISFVEKVDSDILPKTDEQIDRSDTQLPAVYEDLLPASVEEGKKQWEKRAQLKKDWKEAQAEYVKQIEELSFKRRLFGMAPKGAKELQEKIQTTRAAYIGSLSTALTEREEKQFENTESSTGVAIRSGEETHLKHENVRAKYKTYFISRFVLKDVQGRLEAQKPVLSEKQQERLSAVKSVFQQHRTKIILGRVAVAGAVGGALFAAQTLGKLVGTAAAAGYVGKAVWKYGEKGVQKKQEALASTEAEVGYVNASTSYESLLSELDTSVQKLEAAHKAVQAARRNQKITTTAAAGATAMVVGGGLFSQDSFSASAGETPDQSAGADADNEAISPVPNSPATVLPPPDFSNSMGAAHAAELVEAVAQEEEAAQQVAAAEAKLQTETEAVEKTVQAAVDTAKEMEERPPMQYSAESAAVETDAASKPLSFSDEAAGRAQAEIEASAAQMRDISSSISVPEEQFTVSEVATLDSFTIERGDTVWDWFEGQTNLPQPEIFSEVPPENLQALIDLTRDTLQDNPKLAAQAGLHINSHGELTLYAGDTVSAQNVELLDEIARGVAEKHGLLDEQSVKEILQSFDEIETVNTSAETEAPSKTAEFVEKNTATKAAVTADTLTPPPSTEGWAYREVNTPTSREWTITPSDSIDTASENDYKLPGTESGERSAEAAALEKKYTLTVKPGQQLNQVFSADFRAGELKDVVPEDMSRLQFMTRLWHINEYIKKYPEIGRELGFVSNDIGKMVTGGQPVRRLPILETIAQKDFVAADIRKYLKP